MRTLEQVADDLKVMDEEETLHTRPWGELEKKLDEVQDAKNPGRCAYIKYGTRQCGLAGAGSDAYVVNRYPDRAVVATVHVSWTIGNNYGSYDMEKRIAAKSMQSLGCTRGGGNLSATYIFKVVGCRIV